MSKTRRALKVRLFVLLISLSLFGLFTLHMGERPLVKADSPQDIVERAWKMADDSGVYNFSTQLEQTTYPSPSLANVGSSSQTDRFALDGQIDRPTEIMDLTLYPNSNRSPDAGLRMRIDGDTAYGLGANGNWEKMENIGDVFAPSNDPLGYLAAAQNIQFAGNETFGPETFNGGHTNNTFSEDMPVDLTFQKYTFDVDGNTFAQYMQQQMEAQLQDEGKLPQGVSLSGTDVYKEMSGTGYIWIDANGLPGRFMADLSLPPQSGSGKIDFQVVTTFNNFDLDRISVAQATPFSDPLTWASSTIFLPENIHIAQLLGSQLSLVLAFAALFFLLLYSLQHRRREFIVGLNLCLIIAMVFTPLLNAEQASALQETITADYSEQEAFQAEQERQTELEKSYQATAWNPTQPASEQLAQTEAEALMDTADDVQDTPFSTLLTPELQTGPIDDLDSTDTDGDGLIDIAENALGTDLNNADSDGDSLPDGTEYNQLGLDPAAPDSDLDSIPDNVEVAGFVFAGQQYYLNPLKSDTNNDGLNDAIECPALSLIAEDPSADACLDTDGDGEPDVFDFDNDNDGVPDKVDLSPNSTLGNENAFFDKENPFTFNIDGLETDQPVLVNFQLRPVNPKQVYYSGSIFDWPTVDLAGQVLRYGSTTFATTPNTDIRLDAPNANNGDLHVSPKLEIYVPYDSTTYGSLPKLASADGSSTDVGDWLDTSKLEPFGITVQQADDDGNLYLYIPLSTIEDDTGGNLVGFSGQTLYWPSTGSWGADQEVRLVWVVQGIVNNNPGVSGDSLSVLHIYEDEPWYLTGMSVREDYGFNIALAVKDQTVDPVTAEEAGIFQEDEILDLATSLSLTFVEGVDCTFANATDTQCTLGDSMMTVDDIYTRFNHETNDTTTDGERWFINDSIAVEKHSYDHIGFMSQVAMTDTKSILNTYFSSDDTPLVLFAREETSRGLNLEDTTGSLATDQTLDLTMDDGGPKTTTHSVNIAPFKNIDGEWSQYPLADYLETFEDLLVNHPEFQAPDGATQYDQDVAQGEIIAAQMYLSSLYMGVVGMVAVDDNDYLNVDSLYTEKALQSRSSFLWGGVATGIASAFFNYVVWGSQIHTPSSNSGIMYKLHSAFGNVKQGKGVNFQLANIPLSRAGRLTLGVTVAAILALSIWALVSHITNGGDWLDSIFIVLNAASAVVVSVQIVNVIANWVRVVQDAANITYLSTASFRILNNVTSSIRSTSVLTLVLSVIVTWALFAYMVLRPGADLNQYQINALAAYSVAATVYTVFLFALAFVPIIGPLLVLFIGLFDAITFIVCKATEDNDRNYTERQVCKGIAGIFTETLAKIFYDVEPLVDISDPYRLRYDIEGPNLLDDSLGFSVENGVSYSAEIRNQIGPYKLTGTFQDDIFARKTTLSYQFQTSKTDFHSSLGLNGSSWTNQVTEVDTIGGFEYGYLVSSEPETLDFTFDFADYGPGINVPLPPLYLSEGYVLPIKECSIIVCWVDDTEEGTNHFNISRKLSFDIFPATLDDFFELAEKDGGYSLAWGLTTAQPKYGSPFPRMKDADNDGLRNKADGGSDVDDSKWDTDNDGLSDFYEFSVGSNPRDVDSDNDGLTDYEEARYGSDLNAADSDNDGLSDLLEYEGWTIGYLDKNGEIQTTQVWSDPLFADADSDGILDYNESLYGLNPNVPDRFDLIENAFDFGGLSVDEAQSPQVYIPFNEAAGPVYKNLAGRLLSAFCDTAVCPTTTTNGRYATGVQFDGINDVLTIDDLDFADQSFTISAWVQRDGSGQAETIVSQGTAVNNQGLTLGFNNSDQFTCGFWGDDLTTATAYPETDWHHWSCAYDANSGTRTIYRDGLQVAQDTATANYQGSGPLAIGWLAPNNSGTYFAGTIDELLIHDRALAAGEVAKVRDGIYTLNDLFVQPEDTLNYNLTTQNNLISREVNGHFYIQPEEGSPLIVDSTYQPVSVPPLSQTTIQGDIDVAPTAPQGTYDVDLVAEGVVSAEDESDFFVVAPEPDTGIYFEKDQFGDTAGVDRPNRIGTNINTTCSYDEPFGDVEQCPTLDPNGYFGRGLTFDSTDQSLLVEATDTGGDMDFIVGDFTIGAWVYPTHDATTDEKHAVLGYYEPDQLWFDFRDQGSATSEFFDKAGSTAATCSGSDCPVPAYNFDGNDKLTLPSSANIDLQTITDFTIMLDFSITPLAVRGGDRDELMVLYEQGGADAGIKIYADEHFDLGSYVNFCAYDNAQSFNECIQVFVEDEHRDRFFFTLNGSAGSMSVYQDGTQVGTTAYSPVPSDGDGIGVGNINGTTDGGFTSAPWYGTINRLAFFPEALAQEDVTFFDSHQEGEFFPTLYVENNSFGFAYGYNGIGSTVLDSDLIVKHVPIPQEQWNHIAVTYDESEELLTFYHNGKPVFTDDQVTVDSPFLNDLRKFRVGWAGGQFGHFEGSIDSIVLYNQALSDDEMLSLATQSFDENATFVFKLDEVPGADEFQYGYGVDEFGTCSGDACPSAGRRGVINWAPYFDGNDAIEISSPFDENIEYFTISTWVKASEGTIFSYREGDYKRFELTTSSFNVTDQMPGHSVGFPNIVTDSEWTHIVATYEKNVGLVLYINGEYAGQTDFNAFHEGQNGLFVIGNLRDGTDGLVGFVDDLRFYNTTFTAEQAQELYERSAPHVQFRFDEDETAVAASDDSQNGFVGEITNAHPGVDGRLGNGLLIDNSIERSYLEIDPSANAAQNLDKNFTIMTWIKRDAYRDDSFETLFDWTHGQINTQINDNGTQSFGYPGGGNANNGEYPFQLGEWDHVAFTVDDFNVSRLYLNGELVSTGTFYSDSPVGIDQFLIGIESNRANRGFVNAVVDEFTVYERALSSLEIADSYRLDSRWTRSVETFRVTVDTDSPTVELRSDPGYVLNQSVMLDVATSDPTSQVVVVDVGVLAPNSPYFVWLGAPACEDAAEGVAWCPTFDPAYFGNAEGLYTVKFRVADQAGNETVSQEYQFYVDGSAPEATAVANDTWNTPTQTGSDSWEIPLSGTVTDPELAFALSGSGVNEDSLQITLLDAAGDVAGYGVQSADVTGSNWQIDYLFEGQRPNGLYDIQLRVEDTVGNVFEDVVGSVRIDIEAGRFDIYSAGVANENAPQGTAANSSATAAALNLLPTDVLTSAHTLSGTASDLPLVPGNVLNLHFELNDGTAFADSGLYGNHATCNSCPALTTGVFGQALDFSSGNSLSAPTTDIFNVAPNMTLMAWISPDTIPASGTARIMTYGDDTAVLSLNNGDLVYSMTLDGVVHEVRAADVLVTSTFQHVAGSYDGTTLRLYHNGLLVGESDVTGAIDDSVGVEVGSAGEPFDGQIDEVALYNRSLIALEIFKLAQSVRATVADMELSYELLGNGSLAANLPLPQGTLLYLPVNELSTDGNGNITTSFADYSGADQSATCVTATCPTAGNLGFVGSGLTFDGVDDELTVASFMDPGAASFTAAAWVNLDSIAGMQTILSQQSGASWLGINGSGNLFTDLGSGLTSSEVVTPGVWHHTAVIYDGTMLSLYLDGQLVNSAATSIAASSGDLRLGLSEAGGNRFAGAVDEVMVVGEAVTTAELRQLMVDASPIFSLNFDEVDNAVNGDLLASGWKTAVTAQLISNDTADKISSGQVEANALALDGYGDYVSVAANPLLDLSHGRYTQMAWVYPELIGDEVYPVISSLATGSELEAYPFIELVDQTKLHVGFGDGTALHELTTGSVLTANAWNHIAVSFDGSDLRVFVNGVKVAATSDFAGLTPFATQQFDLGQNGVRTFEGELDAVQIFPRTLSAAEILEQASITGWQEATLATPDANLSTWSQPLPQMEGLYRLNGRSTDTFNNTSVPVPLWEGVIDTMAPRATVTYRFIGDGATAQTEYSYTITDLHADPNGITGLCIDPDPTTTPMNSAWYRTSLGYTAPADSTIYQVAGVCQVSGHQTELATPEFCDALGNCAVIPAEDTPPVAVDDTAVTDEEVGITIDVIANDSDVENGGLTITAVTQPLNGQVTFSDSSLTYTPTVDFFGEDSFTYTISDTVGQTDTAEVTVTVNNLEDAPTAVNDFLVKDVQQPQAYFNVLSNDYDADGDPITLDSVTQPANGATSINTFDATVIYTPTVGFFGQDTFDYTISDDKGNTSSATVTVTVYEFGIVFEEPAEGSVLTVGEPISLTYRAVVDVDLFYGLYYVSITERSDSDENTFYVKNDFPFNPVGVGEHIETITWTPTMTGTIELEGYVMAVAEYQSYTTISLTVVEPENRAPAAVADSVVVDEDSSTTLDVLANDTDLDGDVLTIYSLTQPTNGTLINNGSDVTYTPDADFFGSDSFSYTVVDGNGGSATAVVNITVNNMPDAPVAGADGASTNENTAVTINVLANDSDADGDTVTLTGVTQPANGSVTNNGSDVTYTPNTGFSGADSFTYDISDGSGGTDTATVTVNVFNVNDNPVANSDSAVTNEETGITINVLANDTDQDGDALSLDGVTQPANGTTAVILGKVVYTPNSDFFGSDSFTYTVIDGHGGSATGSVSVTVNNINDEPIANNDTGSTTEETAVTVDVLANDTDVDGDTLTVSSVTQPGDGVVVNNGSSVTYTPDKDFSGSDSFSYVISDGHGATDFATVTVSVSNVNDVPVANDYSAVTDEEVAITLPVTSNDFDGDGDLLTITAVTQPANGTVTYAGEEVTYTPDSDFNGSDSFTYTVSDGNGGSDTATVTVKVNPVNDAPFALDDTAVTSENAVVVIDVLANDGDIDGDILTVGSVTQPTNGTVVNNDVSVTYIPAPTFNGVDTFSYSNEDGQGGTATATVTVTVASVNNSPIAVDDSVTTDEDTAVTIDVLANDTDADGDTLTVDSTTDPANGTVVNNGTDVTYTPNPGFGGIDNFNYTISDGNGGSDTASVTVTVSSVNDAPDAVDDSATTDKDTAVTIDVLANDSDDDGDSLTIDSVTDPANGSVVNNGTDVTYTPDPGFNGTDSFDYTVSDGNGGSDTATVMVIVNEVAGIQADLSVTMSDNADPSDVEQILTYSIVVSNNGPDLATGVTMTDTLPLEVDFVSVTTNQGSCSEDDDEVTCQLDDIASGASATITLQVMPEEVGTITNLALVFGNEADPDLTNNTASESTTVTEGFYCNGVPATIVGTSGDDILNGTSGDDVIVGLDGNDIINGNDGNDIICGGSGADLIYGGSGQDLLKGGQGADALVGNGGADELHGGRGADALEGGFGADVLFGGRGDDLLEGNEGSDVLRGRRGDDLLLGGAGADELYGGRGNDVLQGGIGPDMLDGGRGDDLLLGQSGLDTLKGGQGNDDLRGGTDADELFGGVGYDLLIGNSGSDFCDGGLDLDIGFSCETAVDIP